MSAITPPPVLDAMAMAHYRCPQCQGNLVRNGDSAKCGHCGCPFGKDLGPRNKQVVMTEVVALRLQLSQKQGEIEELRAELEIARKTPEPGFHSMDNLPTRPAPAPEEKPPAPVPDELKRHKGNK